MMKLKIRILAVSVFIFLFILPNIVIAGGGNSSNVSSITLETSNVLNQDDKASKIADNLLQKESIGVNWPDILIGAIIGWLSGLASVVLIDYLKKPNISFEVGSEAEDTVHKWRFIHIRVKNLKKSGVLGLFGTLPAFSCKAIVRIDDKSFVGRWTSKEQPIGSIPDVINKALVHPREDIFPFTGDYEAVEIAVGIKYDGEVEFYGFNNESYLHKDLKDNSRKYKAGIYDGSLTISTMGKVYSNKFKIYNNTNNRKDFHLELT